MEKDSALYQLMDTRMNGVMNGIVSGDGEYQAIIRKSDEYSGKLDGLKLPREVRLLIDGYVSEQRLSDVLAWQQKSTFIIISFSSGFDSAIIIVRATSVWSSISFSPFLNKASFLSKKYRKIVAAIRLLPSKKL